MRRKIFKIYSLIRRFFIRISGDKRPSSAPYLSGDTFRSIADHIFDYDKTFDPGEVKEGDKVFVEINRIQEFFKDVHPKIKNKYVLITHNSDIEIGEALTKNLDGKIIRWYGQNVLVDNPLITPLPIGLENLHHYNNGIPKLFDRFRRENISKKDRIVFGFNIKTNPKERQPAFDVLSKNRLAEKIEGWPTPTRYIRTLASYKFVASPPGNGIDCIRTWEAMYLRTIPIVKDAVMYRYFRNLGLPIMIIKDWNELDGFSEKYLSDRYAEIMAESDDKALFIDYWINKFNNIE